MKPTPLLLLPSGFPEKNTIFLFSVMNLPSPNHHDSAKPNMSILHLSIFFSMITNCHVVSPCTFHVAMYDVFRKDILFPSTIEVCNDMLHTIGLAYHYHHPLQPVVYCHQLISLPQFLLGILLARGLTNRHYSSCLCQCSHNNELEWGNSSGW